MLRSIQLTQLARNVSATTNITTIFEALRGFRTF